MDEFSEKISQINIPVLKEFVDSIKKPCYESELLKLIFKDIDIVNDDALTLYQNHFVLFHVLYKLQEEYQKENKYLHIHFMRTFLSDYPGDGKCRFYNDSLSLFCNEQCSRNAFYCESHIKIIGDRQIDLLSEKYFYLDIDNYFKLNKETAEAFVSGAWEILHNYEEYKKSFRILELPESSDYATIKKRFKYLAKIHHPDIGGNIDDKFKEINNAYQFLIKVMPKII